jgi:RNA polymerase sigma factor (sigma-70 family)
MNKTSEKALMYSIGCGDVRAMKHIVDTYLELVCRTSFRILCDRKDCEAVTCDVFVYVWNNAEKFDGSLSLESWILRHTCRYSRQRAVRRRIMYIFGQRPDLYVTTAPKAADYDDYLTKQAWELFCRVSQTLSTHQRVLFTLCALEELPVDEVARITGTSRFWINSLVSTAESKIRKELRKKGKPEDYSRYVSFLRKVAEGFTEHDKLKRMIMSSIR